MMARTGRRYTRLSAADYVSDAQNKCGPSAMDVVVGEKGSSCTGSSTQADTQQRYILGDITNTMHANPTSELKKCKSGHSEEAMGGAAVIISLPASSAPILIPTPSASASNSAASSCSTSLQQQPPLLNEFFFAPPALCAQQQQQQQQPAAALDMDIDQMLFETDGCFATVLTCEDDVDVAARSAANPDAPRNIDEGDDPQLCLDYVNDIYNNLRSSEVKLAPSATYLEDFQRDINPSMRAILIDWLVEVAEEYRLSSDTLYLSVNLIDRFLTRNPVLRGRLQLVGMACIFLAAKYEEIQPPLVDELVYISDSSYTRDEIIQMESVVINTLEFTLTAPTAKLFLRRFIKAAEADLHVATLASYLAELTLQEHQFLKYRPSMVAACAVSLSLALSGQPCWTPTLEHYTQYSQAALAECLQEMHEVFSRAAVNSLQSVREKYSSSRFHHVAQTAARAF